MRPILFERRVSAALRDACALETGETIVVAVSGGADSMALLSALRQAAIHADAGWRLHVAHLNHGLRGEESDADAAFVARACDAAGIPCTVETADLSERSAGMEERARRARYSFLERVARAAGARCVATAHHADDQAETVLHHVIRGSGLRGAAGMRPARPIRRGSDITLVRPMLGVPREQIREYLRQRGVSHREDGSNAETNRTRNRIRHRVMPILESELNPNARQALARLATVARWTNDFLDDAAKRALSRAVIDLSPSRIVIDTTALAAEPPIVRITVAMRALRRLRIGEQRLRFEHLLAVSKLMSAERSKRSTELPGRLTAVAARGRLTIARSAVAATA